MPERPPETCIEIPPLPDADLQQWSWQRAWSLLKCFGPAAILASMSIGAGETIVVVLSGAWAKYDLLWVVLLACVVKSGFITYMLGRYTAVSGEYIGHRLVHLPGPRGWFLLLIVGVEVIFSPLAWVAIARPCGNLLHYTVSQNLLDTAVAGNSMDVVYENLYTTGFIGLALLVSLTLTYDRLEKEQLIICGILVVGTVIGTVMVRPDLWEALVATLANIGRLPKEVPAWAPAEAKEFPYLNLATVFAYVGGSVSGYVAYADWIGVRRWGLTGHPDIEEIRRRAAQSPSVDYLPTDPVQRRRLLRLMAPLRWDISLGTMVLFVVTACFMLAGAATLYDEQSSFDGWRLLTDQAHIWRNIHPWLVPVYYVTVIAALWGTLTALPDVYTRVTHEFFSAIWPEQPWNFRRIRLFIACWLFVTSSIVIWANLPFTLLIQVAGFFVANLAIAAIAVAAFYLNHKLPRDYRVCTPVFVGAVAATAVLIAASMMSTYGLVSKLNHQFSTSPQVEISPTKSQAIRSGRLGPIVGPCSGQGDTVCKRRAGASTFPSPDFGNLQPYWIQRYGRVNTMAAEVHDPAARGLLDFRAPQQTLEIGGVKIGGQPGVVPTVLIGSIFYHGHKLNTDEDRGDFDQAKAEEAIRLQEDFAERTGCPGMLDVVGATSEALQRHLEFAAGATDMPLLLDGTTTDVRLGGLRYVAKAGLTDRIVYNSIQPEIDADELAAIRDAGVKNALLLTYYLKDFTGNGRVQAVRELLPKIREAGITNLIVDTCVMDLATMGQACSAIFGVKDEFGLPAGGGVHNAVAMWRGLRKKMGDQAEKPCVASASAAAVAVGADFVLYGPIEDAKYVFPAVAMVDTALSQLAIERGNRPEKSHPRFRIG